MLQDYFLKFYFGECFNTQNTVLITALMTMAVQVLWLQALILLSLLH